MVTKIEVLSVKDVEFFDHEIRIKSLVKAVTGKKLNATIIVSTYMTQLQIIDSVTGEKSNYNVFIDNEKQFKSMVAKFADAKMIIDKYADIIVNDSISDKKQIIDDVNKSQKIIDSIKWDYVYLIRVNNNRSIVDYSFSITINGKTKKLGVEFGDKQISLFDKKEQTDSDIIIDAFYEILTVILAMGNISNTMMYMMDTKRLFTEFVDSIVMDSDRLIEMALNWIGKDNPYDNLIVSVLPVHTIASAIKLNRINK